MGAERVVAVAGQIAAALDAAHEQNLIHRDVKPSNVLVDHRGHCYLSDFGLSRLAGEGSGPGDSTLVGTVAYVAPEQVRGDALDGRADLYSLACVIFEMLTGDVPYRRPTEVATLFAHLQDDPPSAQQLRPQLPVAVDDVLFRGLAKDPGERQNNCTQLVDEIGDALGVRRAESRHRLWFLAVAVVAAMIATAVFVWAPWLSEPVAATPTGALVHIDPVDDHVAGRTSVEGYPNSVASTPGGIWMGDFRDGVLWRFDPATDALQRISSPGEPRDLAVQGDDIYVASDGPEIFSGNVSRHDSRTGQRESAVTLTACAIGSGDSQVWVAGCPFVQRLSTDDGQLRELTRVLVPFVEPLNETNNRVQIRELAVGLASVWVLGDAVDRRLWRLDAQTGKLQATVDLPFPPRSVAVGENLVWITDPLGDAVVPVDPATNQVLPAIPVGRGAAGVAVGAGAVWVANTIDGTVSRIDPAARQQVATIDVGGPPRELTADATAVWVTTHAP
jgi:serine/threonine-protein kinase